MESVAAAKFENLSGREIKGLETEKNWEENAFIGFFQQNLHYLPSFGFSTLLSTTIREGFSIANPFSTRKCLTWFRESGSDKVEMFLEKQKNREEKTKKKKDGRRKDRFDKREQALEIIIRQFWSQGAIQFPRPVFPSIIYFASFLFIPDGPSGTCYRVKSKAFTSAVFPVLCCDRREEWGKGVACALHVNAHTSRKQSK